MKFIKEKIAGFLLLTVTLLFFEGCPNPVTPGTSCNCDSLTHVIDSLNHIIAGEGIHCNDDQRYPNHNPTPDGGSVVDGSVVGKKAISDFKDYISVLFAPHGPLTPPPPNNRGIYISKQAFDKIFDDNRTANGITFYFALDISKKFNLVLDPVSYNNGNYGIQVPGTPLPPGYIPVFMGNDHSLCPTVCGNDNTIINP